MESDLDRGVRAWSARIVRAYADATHGPITPETEASIARVLRGPMADCVELAEPAMDWPSDYIDFALERWKAMIRYRTGPRLARVDDNRCAVAMSR